MECLFCKIVAGSIPAARMYENEHVLAFADINPQAPVHLLVIPKKHIASMASVPPEDAALLAELLSAAALMARKHGLEKGFRLVINTGSDGGQTVEHLHIHLLGGRGMNWPPG